MRAAANFSYGDGTDSHKIRAGEEIPEEFLDDIPDRLILEKLAEANPEELSREQLMRLAGVGPFAEDSDGENEPYEMDEDDLREALDNMRQKSDLVEWMATIRPDFDGLDIDDQTRIEMTDMIVEELIGE